MYISNKRYSMHILSTDRYSKFAKYCNHRDKSIPSGGSHAEGIGGSIHTRHSALLEVVDHNRCRKVFAVQSHIGFIYYEQSQNHSPKT